MIEYFNVLSDKEKIMKNKFPVLCSVVDFIFDKFILSCILSLNKISILIFKE